MTEPYYRDELVTLYHGDCLEIAEWLTADVLVTDPPYGMASLQGRSQTRTGRKMLGDENTSVRDLALEAWGKKRPALIFGRWDQPRPSGTHHRLIWDKVVGGLGDLSFPWSPAEEEIYATGVWPPIVGGGRRREGGKPARHPNVIRCATLNSQAHERPAHPSPKPVALMELLITKTIGTIADPFAGSGSTLLASRNLGRQSIGVEIEERYCELIVSRLSQQAFDFGSLT